MWIFLVSLALILGFFYLGAFTIFFAEDITEWLEAKADFLRAKAEAIKQETQQHEGIAHKEGTE